MAMGGVVGNRGRVDGRTDDDVSRPRQPGRCCRTDPLGIPVGKVLHVAAYAFLAGFAALLRRAGAWRWLILMLLLEHGVATEWIQGFVPERTSSVSDMVIDHCGVALGVTADVAVVGADAELIAEGPPDADGLRRGRRRRRGLIAILGRRRASHTQRATPATNRMTLVQLSNPTGRSSARSSSLT